MTQIRSSNSAVDQAADCWDYQTDATFPKLEVCNISKTFQNQGKPLEVLRDIDLQLYPNEFNCIVGASGCGKSTLLNIVAGLESPSTGEVRVDGKAVPGPGSDRGWYFRAIRFILGLPSPKMLPLV